MLAYQAGTFPDISQSELAKLLAKLARHAPNLLVELVDHNADYDARISLDMFQQEDEIFSPLWEEDYVLCMLPEHPLARQDSVDLNQLHQHDFIECPPCEAHQQTVGLLACDGLAVNLVVKRNTKPKSCTWHKLGLGFHFFRLGFWKPRIC